MTGIKYMDELAAPRRSLHPGIQPIPQSRNVSDIPLAEFVTAMAIDVPQLDLYSRVSRDLEAWIEKSKIVFTQAEEEAAKVTPELFIEYARADEVGREELGVNSFPLYDFSCSYKSAASTYFDTNSYEILGAV
jgi:kinetochore protein Spc7/SPC105